MRTFIMIFSWKKKWHIWTHKYSFQDFNEYDSHKFKPKNFIKIKQLRFNNVGVKPLSSSEKFRGLMFRTDFPRMTQVEEPQPYSQCEPRSFLSSQICSWYHHGFNIQPKSPIWSLLNLESPKIPFMNIVGSQTDKQVLKSNVCRCYI